MRKASDKSKLRAVHKILDEFSLNHQNQKNLKTATATEAQGDMTTKYNVVS